MTDIKRALIDQAQEQRRTQDTLILQKVNSAHRTAFKTRFPGQVEHCMRLTAERLQALLTNKPTDLSDPETWTSTAAEIASLSQALYYLTEINRLHLVEIDDGTL